MLAQLVSAGAVHAAPLPSPSAGAGTKAAPARTPAAVPSKDKGCTLSPSLTHATGELTSCLSVGAKLSKVPAVGSTAVLTVTVMAGRAEPATAVTIDLPRTLAFADGTASTHAYNGGGPTLRSAPAAVPLKAGQTRSFARTVKAVAAGFGGIEATAKDRVSAARTDSGRDSIFLTVAATAAKSRLGASARVATTHGTTARAHYTGAAPERRTSVALRSVPAGARPATQRPAARPATAGTSCLTGNFYYVDQANVTRAAHNVTVQVRNSANTVLAAGFTGGDGSYNVCYATGGATTSVYAQFQLQNNVWSVQDFSNNVYTYSTGLFTVPDGTTYNVGGLQAGAASDQRAVHAFQEADDEWQWMYQYVPYQNGCWSPYDTTCQTLTIHWAADNTTMGTNWNPTRGVWLLAVSPDTLDEPVHEDGHALMYELYGQTFPNLNCGQHFLFVAQSQVCAWTEGWADWVATSVYNNTVWTFGSGGSQDFNVTWNEGQGYDTGDDVEGRIVQAIRSITDGTKAPWDHDAGEGGGIKDNSRWFNTLHTYRPNTFADVWNDRAALGYDVSQTALSALYQGTIDYGFRNPLSDYIGTHYPEAVPDHNYSHTTSTGYWSVVAVKPDAGSDVDLTLYNDFAQTSSLAASSYGGTSTDFVGINSNTGHRALQTYYPRVHQFAGSGGYTIEEAQGTNILSSGSSTPYVDASQPVRVWDSYQTSGTPVYYRAVPSSGSQDLQLVSLPSSSDLVSRSAGVSGTDPGFGNAATLQVTPSASGYSGLVLLNNGLTSGNVTVYADTTGPDSESVSINSGAVSTTSRNVNLTLGATDAQTGITAMQISTDGVFDSEPVVPYSTSATATLPGASGTKTVYARYENNAGIWSAPVSDTINLTLPPTITSVAPKSGPLAGGQTVTILGTDFIGANSVKFGATAAASFTVVSATKITAVTPAHAIGGVNTFVKTPRGTSSAVSGDVYTFAAAPAVTSVWPKGGPLAGGQTVTITGTAFTNATVVKFGATAAASFTVVSATKITAVTPAESAGAQNVRVGTPSGNSAVVSGDVYTYAPAPAITAVSPTSGPAAGGQTVTITGTAFTNARSVTFSGTAAVSFTVVSATKITAKTPAHAGGVVNIRIGTPSGASAVVSGDRYTFT